MAGKLHHFCRAKLVDTLRVWKRKQLTQEALRSRDIQRPPVVSFKLDDLILCSDTFVVGQNINPLVAICKDYQSLGIVGYLIFRVIVVICDSLHQNIFARSCNMQGFGAQKLTKQKGSSSDQTVRERFSYTECWCFCNGPMVCWLVGGLEGFSMIF